VLVGEALRRDVPVDAAVAQAELGAVAFGVRRLVLLSAYGPGVGADLTTLEQAAAATGRFDRVEVLHHARRADLRAILPTLTPLDAVIWLGAGVIDRFTDGKPDKSVGMTLARGVLGDELISREQVKGLLDQPALGGPGLIVLAGSDSLTADHASQSGLLAQELLGVPFRPVVGFDGALRWATAQAAAAALLQALGAGETLSAALAEASAAAGGATARTALDPTLADKWLLPKASADFWGGQQRTAKLDVFLKVTPKCVEPVAGACDLAAWKAGVPVPSVDTTASSALFRCDVTVDGPFFTGAAKNAATGTDFEVRGLLRGVTVGEGVLLSLRGSADSKLRDITVLGEGLVESVDAGAGALTLRFGGPAAASTYRDAADRCCIAVTPLLTGQKANEQLSTLRVAP
jgi:hypothetical protein